MSQLTEQHRRLHDLEIIIEEGKQTFIQVGNALTEIKENELYKATHKTFEAYCRGRWGFSKTYANNIVRAAETVQALPAGLATVVATERQARELQKVEASLRPQVLEKAQEIAERENRPLTAQDIADASPVKPSEPVTPKSEPLSAAPTLAATPSGGSVDVSQRPAALISYPVSQCNEDIQNAIEEAVKEFSLDDLRKVAMQLGVMLKKVDSRINALKVQALEDAA